MRRVLSAAVCSIGVVASMHVAGQGVADGPKFEVASIRVRTEPLTSFSNASSPDRYTRMNTGLRELVQEAYHLQRFEVSGGPAWAGNTRFDVIAKAPFAPTDEQRRLMLQALLADRFALKTHVESRELPVYLLQLARTDRRVGKGLTPTTVDCDAVRAERDKLGASAGPMPMRPDGLPMCGSSLQARPGSGGAMTLHWRGSSLTADEIARFLGPYVGQGVIDRTELAGRFDVDLEFAMAMNATMPGPASDSATIFTALPEQLGLKLEPSKLQVDVRVIDSAEMPTPD